MAKINSLDWNNQLNASHQQASSWNNTVLYAIQSQKAVSAYFASEQLLPFVFGGQSFIRADIWRNSGPELVYCWGWLSIIPTLATGVTKICIFNELLVTPKQNRKALNIFIKNIDVLVSSFLFIYILMLWVYGHYKFVYSYRPPLNVRIRRLHVLPFNRRIIQFEFSPTWSCVSLTRSTTSSE